MNTSYLIKVLTNKVYFQTPQKSRYIILKFEFFMYMWYNKSVIWIFSKIYKKGGNEYDKEKKSEFFNI